MQAAERLGVPHISTGELFRDHVERATSLGARAANYMDAGELVPDHLTRAMVQERLRADDTRRGFILDGYPRTRIQAVALDALLEQLDRTLTAAVYLRVSDAELVNRLSSRGRDDDTPQTVRNRLRTFHRYNAPLVGYYGEAGLLHEIDGEGSPEDVAERLNGIFPGAAGFTTI